MKKITAFDLKVGDIVFDRKIKPNKFEVVEISKEINTMVLKPILKKGQKIPYPMILENGLVPFEMSTSGLWYIEEKQQIINPKKSIKQYAEELHSKAIEKIKSLMKGKTIDLIIDDKELFIKSYTTKVIQLHENHVLCYSDNISAMSYEKLGIDDLIDILDFIEPDTHTKGVKFARKCSCCGAGMNSGYVIEGGIYYFCSEKCLDESADKNNKEHAGIPTSEQLKNMSQDEMSDSDNYWTEWEDEDDYEFIFINNELKEIE